MANNYLQFSLSVPLRPRPSSAGSPRPSPPSPGCSTHRASSTGAAPVRSAPSANASSPRRGTTSTSSSPIEPTRDDAEGIGALWLYAEEVGEPEHVASVLESFLKKFRPLETITFSWAYTCSKLRVNEFGGGAAVVTADGTKFLDAQSWAEDLASKFVASPPSK